MNGSDITRVEEVDLYYNGTINGKYRNVVKVGSDLDKQNVKKMMLGNPYTGVTDEEFNQKAKIAGLKPKDIRSTTYDVYMYGEITIPSRMSTYIGMDCVPVRGFMYFGKMFDRYITENSLNIYGKMLIKLPTPRYTVLYNGVEEQPGFMQLKLSDSFINLDCSGDFEWKPIW